MAYNAPPSGAGKYKQGYFTPRNSGKYIGDPSKIVYRSSLELKFCQYMDLSSKVIRWGSEIISIPYMGADNKPHTYHIDFYVEMVDERHPTNMERLLVEVKPYAETQRVLENKLPPKPTKVTPSSLKSWDYALKEFLRNRQKWIYAMEYARKTHMKFLVVTEKLLNTWT